MTLHVVYVFPETVAVQGSLERYLLRTGGLLARAI